MSAYVILDITIIDPNLFDQYKQLAPATIEAYGGRYLARGGTAESLEGDWQPNRIVILEFDSMDELAGVLISTEPSGIR